MTHRPFPRQSLLVSGIALALSAVLPGTAQAQSIMENQVDAQTQPSKKSETTEFDTVVVTGVRGALARAVELKRESATVQDSISALELGKFPDDNVADSLSHITGVSITRTAGGEGQKVSIRGLGPEYTLTTFNGRILATDGPGRDFAFDVLPADVINGADVIKGAQASLTEGAIGGLVNLRSASPFDHVEQNGVVRLEGDHNQMSELNGKKLSAVYSNTFANNTFGMLLGVVLASRKERTDLAGNDGGWTRNPDPNDPTWLYGNAWGGNIDLNGNGELDPNEYGLIGPGQFRVGSIIEEKKRKAFMTKFEWRPSDDVRIVVDGLKTRLNSPQVGYQQSYYTLFAPGRWSNIKVKDGIVTDFTMDNPDPDLRLNPELLNQTTYRVVDTALYGVNGEWKVTDSLKLTSDIYRSTSSRHSGGLDTYVVLRMNQPNTAHVWLNDSGFPNVDVNFDDGRNLASGLAAGKFGKSDFKTHYMSLGGDNIDDRITGGSVNGDWSIAWKNLDLIKFGIGNTDRRKARDLIDNSLNGGADYYSGDNAINVGDLSGNVISHSFSLPGFMSKLSSVFPRDFLAFDVPTYLKALQQYDGHLRPDGTPYRFADAAPTWNPLQSYRVEEKTWMAFVEAVMSGERWDANAGVRVVKTETASQAWEAKITSITANGPFNYTAHYAPPSVVMQKADYTFLLPSANFTWHFTDSLQLRLGLAKTMARPPVDKLAPTNTTESVSWGEFTQVYGGNAELKPYSAKQGDASLEWYFAENSIVNLALFEKRIQNQITTSWEPNQDIGVPGYKFNVMRPINGDHAQVHGVEVGAQHFWESGFGVRAQYTRNWSESWVGGEKRPLEGIAPSVYSLGVMYEHGPWSLGITADHTDGFVTAVNVLGAGFNEQADPYTWMSAHASYRVNDRLTLSLEGQNLLDAQQTYSINGNPLLSQGYYRYGRSVNLSASLYF